MPFDLSELAALLGTMFVGASALLFVAAIGWRIAVRPTMRALLEYRAARPANDPQLLRRVSELEEEVRWLKGQVAQLPDGGPSRELVERPWRSGRERT
jgi:hypothetical protein